MAKLTAIIDIGSNSARLVIFQKTSRFGFHLLTQHKSRVRIGEGAYQQNGYLQKIPMQRAYETLKAFAKIIDEYQVHKTLCVATSALRDAPNRSHFIDRVKKDLNIHVKVIDGALEARYGAIAASNLLPVKDAVTIDIGGGSADMARIKNGKISETFSLDIGTVRLKELFTDGTINIPKAKKFIHKELARLPESFKSKTVIAIGGTARALAKGIMETEDYPLDKIHAFEYLYSDQAEYFDRIINSDLAKLKNLNIKEARFDTIREGALILKSILEHIGSRRVITSGVGVREGVYLHERLRKHKDRFPKDINPSIRSIKDRFDIVDLPLGNKFNIAGKLFEIFADSFNGTSHDKQMLMYALNLSNIGKMLTIYKEHQHAFYIAMQELNYGFTHQEMMTIALILRSKGKKYYKSLYKQYKILLPQKKKLQWLVFVYTLSLIIHENSAKAKVTFDFQKGILTIKGDFVSRLIKEEIDNLVLPNKILTIRVERK